MSYKGRLFYEIWLSYFSEQDRKGDVTGQKLKPPNLSRHIYFGKESGGPLPIFSVHSRQNKPYLGYQTKKSRYFSKL